MGDKIKKQTGGGGGGDGYCRVLTLIIATYDLVRNWSGAFRYLEVLERRLSPAYLKLCGPVDKMSAFAALVLVIIRLNLTLYTIYLSLALVLLIGTLKNDATKVAPYYYFHLTFWWMDVINFLANLFSLSFSNYLEVTNLTTLARNAILISIIHKYMNELQAGDYDYDQQPQLQLDTDDKDNSSSSSSPNRIDKLSTNDDDEAKTTKSTTPPQLVVYL